MNIINIIDKSNENKEEIISEKHSSTIWAKENRWENS